MSHSLGENPSPLFILASSSPRRRELLESVGLPPDDIVPAEIEEIPHPKESPRLFSQRMAQEKARFVAQKIEKPALVLGADTVVAVGRRILGKPKDALQARQFFALLSGRKHRVYSSVALLAVNFAAGDRESVRVVETSVTFSRFSKAQIDFLTESGEWQGKAGGYALQGLAASYIRAVSGSPSGVIGLPLFEVMQLFRGQPHLQGKKRANGTFWPV